MPTLGSGSWRYKGTDEDGESWTGILDVAASAAKGVGVSFKTDTFPTGLYLYFRDATITEARWNKEDGKLRFAMESKNPNKTGYRLVHEGVMNTDGDSLEGRWHYENSGGSSFALVGTFTATRVR